MKDKYRILLVHNYYQHAGGEDSVLENEKIMLERHGHFVALYTRNNMEISSLSGKVRYLFSFRYSRRDYRNIRELIAKDRIDIVHVHNTFPLITAAVYAAAHDEGIPVVQTLHNFRFVCPGALYMRSGKICEECNRDGLCTAVRYGCYRNSKLQTALAVAALSYSRKRHLYDQIDAYIALTEFNKQKFEIAFPWCKGKIYTKPNFVRADENLLKQRTEEPDGYVYIGRLSEEKGIGTLLEAFLQMPEKTLILIGSGSLMQYAQEFVATHQFQNIKILGQLSRHEVMQRLMNCKAMIVPSICYEGFPMTIVEAFACGVPVLGSRLGNVEVIIDEMENGLLFQAGNAEDLADKVMRLENETELCRKLRDGARKAYLQHYTEEVNYARLLEIYDIAATKPVETDLKS